LSTLALGGSSTRAGQSADRERLPFALRYGDLFVLAVALPVFLIAGLPLLGYGAAAGAWLAARAIELVAARRSARALGGGDRRAAVGTLAAATLARVWLIALVVLLVGLAERDAGLAAAVLAAIVFTYHLGALFLGRVLTPGGGA
jgi:hypothetical protein